MAETSRACMGPYRVALLFGAPGVGKGTQGAILHAAPGFVHFSMGDAFRGLDPGSGLGKAVAGYSSRGELVPDEITVELWKDSVARRVQQGGYDPASDLLVLDGVPRNPAQVELLKDAIDVLRIVHISARDEAAMVGRLKRRALRQGRADDAKEDVIRRRWEVYRAETQPVLDMYPSAKVLDVDAAGSPGEVLLQILQGLAPLQAREFGNALAAAPAVG